MLAARRLLDSRARSRPSHGTHLHPLMASIFGARVATPSLTVLLLSCASAAPSSATPSQSAATPAPAPAQRTIPFGDSGTVQKLEPFFPGTTYDPNVPAPD